MDFFILSFHGLEDNLDYEVHDLHGADEGEASEEPHGASYSRQLVHKLGCSVLQICSKSADVQDIMYKYSLVEQSADIK